MNHFWWLGLALMAAPIWWHRQRRQRQSTPPLATARFLPPADPKLLRVWRWADKLLLLLRCLLLAAVVAWLADLVLPWRGDSVLVEAGTDEAWVQRQIKAAGMTEATGIALPPGDPFNWIARHQDEWRAGSRLLLLGDVPMPATKPQPRLRIEVRSKPVAPVAGERRVLVVSKRAAQWRALFAALDGPQRYVVDEAPGRPAELVVWDVPEAPPAELRAPLWWAGDASAFPELAKGRDLGNVRYADSARGRVWASPDWPPADPEAARALFETWQRLHHAPLPYTTPSQVIDAGAAPGVPQDGGALRYLLTLVLLALFALERALTHASRR